MELFGLAIMSIIVGFVVGILSGMLGIGGGTVLVPVFKLGFAMNAIASTATSLFTIIPTSISGVITHIKNKTCIPKLGVAAGIGGAITSPIGVWLASISPDIAIMAAAAAVIAYSAITMFGKAVKSLKRDRAAKAKAGAGLGAQADADQTEGLAHAPAKEQVSGESKGSLQELVIAKNLGVCAAIGVAAGLLSGYVGVGGGFIMVPLFMQLLHLPLRLTSGTSLVAVMILATSGTVMQAIYGNIDWIAGIFVAVGSIPGAFIGSKLITRISETALRFIFSGFLLVAAALLVLNQLQVF